MVREKGVKVVIHTRPWLGPSAAGPGHELEEGLGSGRVESGLHANHLRVAG